MTTTPDPVGREHAWEAGNQGLPPIDRSICPYCNAAPASGPCAMHRDWSPDDD